MELSDLIFTGFNRYVAAVHRTSGKLVWKWQAPRTGYFTLLLDGDRLIVSVSGYLHALEALTGRQLWVNELPGLGTGVASLASVRGGSIVPLAAHAAAAAASSSAA
jgi:hypothetical protein